MKRVIKLVWAEMEKQGKMSGKIWFGDESGNGQQEWQRSKWKRCWLPVVMRAMASARAVAHHCRSDRGTVKPEFCRLVPILGTGKSTPWLIKTQQCSSWMAYWSSSLQVEGKRVPLLVVLGVRIDGRKELLWFGQLGAEVSTIWCIAEAKECWHRVFQHLKEKELKSPLGVVNDFNKLRGYHQLAEWVRQRHKILKERTIDTTKALALCV